MIFETINIHVTKYLHYMFKQMLLIETDYVEKESFFLLLDFFYLMFVIEAIPELQLHCILNTNFDNLKLLLFQPDFRNYFFSQLVLSLRKTSIKKKLTSN